MRELEEQKELYDWLAHRGLCLGECAAVMADMDANLSLGLALLKVSKHRDLKKTEDWGNPVTP